eukprot:TRINITY_DN963_c0_g1_i4.p1 TRINITY_DN963_c0_g1~~TRINITY_DN963_c0_g1_i4.p1  ORF type:complete len:473 (+),score=54.65 TRINITY_DN963_c0_g1_i4:141-1559(+)
MAIVAPPSSFGPSTLRIKQESELVPKFGGWLRSNNRGTDSTLIVSGSEELMQTCKNALQGRNPAASATLTLSLRYEDTQEEVQLIARHQHPDKVACIPVRGGHKAAVTSIKRARIELGAESSMSTQEFASAGELSQNKDGTCSLSIGIKFSTNITSTNHSGRTMFWRGELVLASPAGCVATQADSHAFEYHPREPKSGDAPRLDLVLCDGRPGELIILHGERLGSVYKELRCKIEAPGQPPLILEREILQGSQPSSCFTARLPADVAACATKVSVVVNAQLVSNQLTLNILRPQDAPALPTQPISSKNVACNFSRNTTIAQPTPSLKLDGPLLPLSGGPLTKSRRQQQRQGRRDAPYPEQPTKQDVSLICAPSSAKLWDLSANTPTWNTPTGAGFDYTSPMARPPLSRQSSDELCQRLSSWLNDHHTPTGFPPLSRSNSKELGDCRLEMSDSFLPLSRLNSEDLLLAAGSVF